MGLLSGLVSGGLSLLGGAVSSKSSSKANRQAMEWQAEQNRLQRDQVDRWNQVGFDFAREQQNEAIRQFNRGDLTSQQMLALSRDQIIADDLMAIGNRVLDAKRAGIHPLYALGMSSGGGGVAGGVHGTSGGSFSPGSSSVGGMPGQFETGSALGSALSAAGGFLRNREERREAQERLEKAQARADKRDALNTRLAEARVRTEELEAQRIASEIKRAEQRVNETRPTVQMRDTPPWPEEKVPKSLVRAPSMEYRRKDGSRATLSTPLDMDEVKQAEYLYNEARHWMSERMLDLSNWAKKRRQRKRAPYRSSGP